MGDRTGVVISVPTRDAARLQEALDWGTPDYSEEEIPGVTSLTFSEVNYAGYNDRLRLATEGFQFYGHHDEGAEYDGSVFATDSTGQMVECLSSRFSPGPLVEVLETGEPDPKQLAEVRAYYAARAAIRDSANRNRD